MLELWPAIKKEVPDATLDIYYGWNNYDAWHAGNEIKLKWKDDVVKLIDELASLGVKEHGRIPAHILASKYQEASVWAYPTEWTETYCITAIKAQLGGAVPVTTDVAALAETAKYGEIIRGGDIYSNKKAQKEFVQRVAKVCHNRDKYPVSEMQEWARSLTWAKVAQDWDKLFKVHLETKK